MRRFRHKEDTLEGYLTGRAVEQYTPQSIDPMPTQPPPSTSSPPLPASTILIPSTPPAAPSTKPVPDYFNSDHYNSITEPLDPHTDFSNSYRNPSPVYDHINASNDQYANDSGSYPASNAHNDGDGMTPIAQNSKDRGQEYDGLSNFNDAFFYSAGFHYDDPPWKGC